MGNDNSPLGSQTTADLSRPKRTDQEAAESQPAYNPDTELHLDGEKDTLYSDGLDIKENSDTLFGTRGTSPGAIKP